MAKYDQPGYIGKPLHRLPRKKRSKQAAIMDAFIAHGGDRGASSAGATMFIADVHLGNIGPFGGEVVAGLNARCRMTLGALQAAVEIGKKNGVTRIVSLGDFFDSSDTPPQVVAAAQTVIADLQLSGRPLEWIFLCGNHEMGSAAPYDNSLEPLSPLAKIVRPGWSLRLGDLDLRPYAKDLSTLEPFEPGVVGCLHAGIYDESFPPYAKGQADAISVARLRELGATKLVAGNWHKPMRWGERDGSTPKRLGVEWDFLQVGSLVPKNFGELGPDYGRVAIYRDGKFGVVEVPGPRFARVSSEKELAQEIESMHNDGCFLLVEWVASGEDGRETATEVLSRDALSNVVRAWRVVPAPMELAEVSGRSDLWSGSASVCSRCARRCLRASIAPRSRRKPWRG